jgi:hypothetical protein
MPTDFPGIQAVIHGDNAYVLVIQVVIVGEWNDPERNRRPPGISPTARYVRPTSNQNWIVKQVVRGAILRENYYDVANFRTRIDRTRAATVEAEKEYCDSRQCPAIPMLLYSTILSLRPKRAT